MKFYQVLIIILLVFGLGCLSGVMMKKPKIVNQIEYVAVIDSVKVQTLLTKAKSDSVKLENLSLYLKGILKESNTKESVISNLEVLVSSLKDSLLDKIYVASADTTFDGYGDLSVVYFYKPLDRFSLQFSPVPQQIQFVEKEKIVDRVVYKQRWYSKLLYLGAGFGAKALIEQVSK